MRPALLEYRITPPLLATGAGLGAKQIEATLETLAHAGDRYTQVRDCVPLLIRVSVHTANPAGIRRQ